jgi:hypothetical protein
MRPEDLAPFKKYKHPDFNFEMIFYRLDLETCGDNPSYMFMKPLANSLFFLERKEVEKMIEVREPIKKEQVSYSFVNFKMDATKDQADKITGLYTALPSKSIKELLDVRYAEVNEVIVKHITTSIELTDEEIKEQLKKEESN